MPVDPLGRPKFLLTQPAFRSAPTPVWAVGRLQLIRPRFCRLGGTRLRGGRVGASTAGCWAAGLLCVALHPLHHMSRRYFLTETTFLSNPEDYTHLVSLENQRAAFRTQHGLDQATLEPLFDPLLSPKMKAYFDSLPVGFLVLPLFHHSFATCVWANSTMCKLMGTSLEIFQQLAGQGSSVLAGFEGPRHIAAQKQAFLSGKREWSWIIDIPVASTGRTVQAMVTKSVLTDEDDAVVGCTLSVKPQMPSSRLTNRRRSCC